MKRITGGLAWLLGAVLAAEPVRAQTDVPSELRGQERRSWVKLAPEYREWVLASRAAGRVLAVENMSVTEMQDEARLRALAARHPEVARWLAFGSVTTVPARPPQVVRVPAADGRAAVTLYLYAPSASAPDAGRPWIYYIHGGGYTMGRATDTAPLLQRLADETGAVVAGVDYRLAPQAVFPAPLEDCYTGIVYLHAQAARFGLDARRVAVMGESAGGGLAAALNLLLRDRGALRPLGQLLVVPMLDDRTGTWRSPYRDDPHAGAFSWSRSANRAAWRALRGGQRIGRRDRPYFVPARADDVAGLPPAFIAVGSIDLFAAESRAYAEKLRKQGVAAELHVYEGVPHTFMLLDTPQSRAYYRALYAAVRRMLGS